MLIKFSRACFLLMGVTFGVMILVVIVSDLIGLVHGDTSSITISGSPSLDSPSIPYWVHWMHAAMYYSLPVMLGSLLIGFIALVVGVKLEKGS